MSAALFGLGGTVIGALIAALVGLVTARQANEHAAELARAELRERRAAELRALRADAYAELVLKLVQAREQLYELSAQPIEYPFSNEDWLRAVARTIAVGSDPVRTTLLRGLGGRLKSAKLLRERWIDSLKHGEDYDGDERVRLRRMHEAVIPALNEDVESLIDRLNSELTSLADFSRTEAV